MSSNSIGVSWITKGSLPAEEEAALMNTVTEIKAGTKPAGAIAKKWGTTFWNKAGDLPGVKGVGGYLEYRVVPAPGTVGVGVRRVITTTDGSIGYYTWTHYGD